MTNPDKVYRDTVVRPFELVDANGKMDGFEFYDCTIDGPAVLFLVTNVNFTSSRFVGKVESLLWQISPHRESVVGAIGMSNCSFERCTFQGIGFAGSSATMSHFRRQLGSGSPRRTRFK